MEAKGKTGRIEFDGEYVTIHRDSFLARSTVGKGQKRLHVAQITAVQWKPAGAVVNGFIQFTVPGGNERRSKFGSQTNDAAKDENSVVFTKKQEPAFEALRSAVDGAIAAQHAPVQAAPAPAASMADELAKLAALVQSGAITKEEFDQAKARLLGS
jgi:hypothetical protein